ncbi:MAG: type II toxin-antitoxin system RelE/ParE family toxin [Deltaproteobacteria bacterium]|nr:type II toxin-antitoxin system RelE/ParE family toxin [Deltaproteobacteria bacterium]
MAQRVKRWRLLWTEPARDALREILRFIRQDNPVAARNVSREIRQKVERLTQFPLSGRDVPELPDTGFRAVIIGNYRVIYRVVSNTVEILTVVHGRRKVG